MIEDTLDGKALHIYGKHPAGTHVVATTDSGRTLIYEMKVGEGRVLVLNTLEYAGNPALYALVKETVSRLGAEQFDKEPVWAEGDEFIQFTAYKQDNGDMHFYFLSTDWYCADEPMRAAKLRIGQYKYDLEINFGRMIKAVTSGDTGAWFDSEDCDVLKISNKAVTVQGTGIGTLSVAKDGILRQITVDFSDESVKTLDI